MKDVRKQIEIYKSDPDFQLQELLLDILEQFAAIMAANGITYNDLADRLQVDKSRISRIMNGPDNLTLKTVVRLANCLGQRVHVNIFRTEAKCFEWPDATVAFGKKHDEVSQVGKGGNEAVENVECSLAA